MADAQIGIAIFFSKISDQPHLIGGCIARRRAMRLQADCHDGMRRVTVRGQVRIGPGTEGGISLVKGVIANCRTAAQGRRREGGRDLGQQFLIVAFEQRANLGKTRLDQAGDFLNPRFVYGDLDSRLVFVIAPAQHVVDAQHRLDIGQQVSLWQKAPHRVANHRRAAKATAHNYLKPRFARRIAHHAQADVMRACHRTVIRGTGDGDLELAWQELEFGVVGGPLAQQFRIGARVFDFVRSRPCEMVSRHVAHAVARGLNGVHFHIR